MGAVNRPSVALRGIYSDAAQRSAVELWSETGIFVCETLPYFMAANSEDLDTTASLVVGDGFITAAGGQLVVPSGQVWLVHSLTVQLNGFAAGDSFTARAGMSNNQFAPIQIAHAGQANPTIAGFAQIASHPCSIHDPLIARSGDILGFFASAFVVAGGQTPARICARITRITPAF